MPVKYPLACNFAKKKPFSSIVSVAWLTFVEWRSALKKGKNFESKYHDIKKKSLKRRSTLVCLFTYAKDKKNLKIKSKFIKFIKYIIIIKFSLV